MRAHLQDVTHPVVNPEATLRKSSSLDTLAIQQHASQANANGSPGGEENKRAEHHPRSNCTDTDLEQQAVLESELMIAPSSGSGDVAQDDGSPKLRDCEEAYNSEITIRAIKH